MTWKFKFLIALAITFIAELILYLKYVAFINPDCQEFLPSSAKCVGKLDLILNIATMMTFWFFIISLILVYLSYYIYKRFRWRNHKR